MGFFNPTQKEKEEAQELLKRFDQTVKQLEIDQLKTELNGKSYVILNDFSQKHILEKINYAIELGYEPVGPMTGWLVYSQAMRKNTQ